VPVLLAGLDVVGAPEPDVPPKNNDNMSLSILN
jgi:hypothetical protein